MSQSVLQVDDKFFERTPSEGSGPPKNENVPDTLHRAALRLEFPPSYVVVGAYRLLSDKSLFVPMWQKCRNGFLRGIAVGGVWVCDCWQGSPPKLLTTTQYAVLSDLLYPTWAHKNLLDKVCQLCGGTLWSLSSSALQTLLATQTILSWVTGLHLTYPPVRFLLYSSSIAHRTRVGAVIVLLSSQITFILKFFLSRNLRIARERAWDQTIASRGKGPAFWQPYVEEWDVPPVVDVGQWAGLEVARSTILRLFLKNSEFEIQLLFYFSGVMNAPFTQIVIMIPMHVLPVGGLLVTAAFKALGTARYLHKPVRIPCLDSTHAY